MATDLRDASRESEDEMCERIATLITARDEMARERDAMAERLANIGKWDVVIQQRDAALKRAEAAEDLLRWAESRLQMISNAAESVDGQEHRLTIGTSNGIGNVIREYFTTLTTPNADKETK